MNALSNKLRWKIRKWLGLGEQFMGVDVSANHREQSCIVIVSRLNNGSVRIIDCQFENVVEMEQLVRGLQEQYGIPDRQVFVDLPRGMRRSGW